MANTVNDVMNVIASPDYGIKNIAGTNQEILAILQGTNNSKNNIYNIVNDIKILLQELVEVPTKKKSIEIKGNSSKINKRHIKDILDETKSIRKAIDNLSKSFKNKGMKPMPAVAKLGDKASEMVAKEMIKSMKKQNRGSGLTSIIEAFTKLKDISLKDIIIGKQKIKILSKIFKKAEENLNIKKKTLDNIIKLINASPEMVKALFKIGLEVNLIIKNDTVKKLSDILFGAKNSILSISKKLKKNKKEINEGVKIAKKTTTLIGNLLVTSIFLTIAVVTAGPAILGAKLLAKMVDKTIPIAKKLSKSNKDINKAIGSAIIFTAFTGLMAVSSVFLATMALTGGPAILGSILMVGIVTICSFTFKILAKAKKNVLIGSLVMLVMSTSLVLFGIGLGKITSATKDVNFKQIGVIATLTVLLGGVIAILGIPAVAPFILIGSVSMAVMGIALIPFAKSLSIISKSTKKIKMKDVITLTGSIISLGLGVAAIGPLSMPIIIGSIAILLMTTAIKKFTKTVDIITKSAKQLNIKDVINITKSIITLGLGVAAAGPLIAPITLGSIAIRTMVRVLHKFTKTLKTLSDMGGIPTDILKQTLETLGFIGKFFMENMLNKKVVKNAKRFKKIIRPFGNTVKHLSKLKELGEIPMDLVIKTLNIIATITNYYIKNPIEKKVIKQAKRYKRILRPFGNTVKHLSKLKELGEIPMDLVIKTLNIMTTIANYYIKNPIEKKVIKQAKRYKRILRPFGNAIKHLSKLKDFNSDSVMSSLKAMESIATFFKDNSFDKKQRKKALKTIIVLKNMTSAMTELSNINSSNLSSAGEVISNTLTGIDKVDIGKVQAVTNMFNAFSSINKSESIMNKFTESVKEFTEACKNLMNAMGDNTDAINNMDGKGTSESNIISSDENTTKTSGGVRIANVDELAKTIAEKINGALYVDIPDTQVQLLINGSGGNEWTITRY